MTRSTATAQFRQETGDDGSFVRQANRFTNRVTADGSSGYPAEPGRYQLIVSLACPWAHRQVIVRRLYGLDDVVGLTVVDPWRDERGWRFDPAPDPVTGFTFLSQAYRATDPAYTGRVTVPTLWDRETGQVVTNDYPQLSLDLGSAFLAYAGADPDLYPAALRAEMNPLMERIYQTVNNGVYRAGFATTQSAYEAAYDALFDTLDDLELRLREQRFLMGERITEADVRLFTTLVRFDAVYHNHFKCNRSKLAEYDALWAYARDLYQTPGFGDTTDFDHIKRHYYTTHDTLNPTRIVPKGPATDWEAPHHRG